MSPLGHASISFLAGTTMASIFPSLDTQLAITATTVGGVAIDLDLLHRAYLKRSAFLDKTIGQHRFLPTHTPVFALILLIPISLMSVLFSNPAIFYGGLFFTLGTLVHFLLDTLFFPEGIKFLYPLNNKSFRFLYIKTHPFWAPRKISGVNNWLKMYLSSPIFWISEVAPTIIAIIVLLNLLK